MSYPTSIDPRSSNQGEHLPQTTPLSYSVFQEARQIMLRSFLQWLKTNPDEQLVFELVEETCSALKQLTIMGNVGVENRDMAGPEA